MSGRGRALLGRRRSLGPVALLPLGAALLLAGCGGSSAAGGDAIQISGSSTVAPITELAARQGGFGVDVEAEGTGSGFERFCAGETAINNASTPIPGEGQPVDFVAECEQNGVEYVELPIGLDALSVVRNQDASFVDDLTLDELGVIWGAGSEVTTWSDVRDEWPDEPIGLYGRPDTSGTYAAFSYAVTGDADGLRDDYDDTDDLSELAGWIADDPHGLGYMGVGNYLATTAEHLTRLTTVPVDGVQPTLANAQSGEYGDLARPLLLYVSTEALEQDEQVRSFVDYYLDHAQTVLPRTYFYPLDQDLYDRVKERLDAGTTGTIYGGDPFGTADLEELL